MAAPPPTRLCTVAGTTYTPSLNAALFAVDLPVQMLKDSSTLKLLTASGVPMVDGTSAERMAVPIGAVTGLAFLATSSIESGILELPLFDQVLNPLAAARIVGTIEEPFTMALSLADSEGDGLSSEVMVQLFVSTVKTVLSPDRAMKVADFVPRELGVMDAQSSTPLEKFKDLTYGAVVERGGAQMLAALASAMGATGRLHDWTPSSPVVKTITILHKAISDDLDDDTGMEDALLELLEVFGEPLQLFPLVVLRYAQFASFISWAKLYSCTATQADAMRRKLKAILLAYPTLLRALRGCFDKWGMIRRMAQARFKSETVTPSVLTALDAFCAESKQFFAAQDGAYNAEAAVSRALESAAHRELQITATLHASDNKGGGGGGGGTMKMAQKLQLQMEAYYTDDRYEAALDSIHGLDPVGILALR